MPEEDVSTCIGVAHFRGDRVTEMCSVMGAAGREAGDCLWFQCNAPQCSMLCSEKVWELYSPAQRSFYSCLSEFYGAEDMNCQLRTSCRSRCRLQCALETCGDLDLSFSAWEPWERYCVRMKVIWICFLELVWLRISWMCRLCASWNLPRKSHIKCIIYLTCSLAILLTLFVLSHCATRRWQSCGSQWPATENEVIWGLGQFLVFRKSVFHFLKYNVIILSSWKIESGLYFNFG